MKLYSFCQTTLACLIRCLFRIRVIGVENLPLTGPLMVCANHISMWDPFVIGACLKKIQVHYMAKEELFRIPVLRKFLSALGAYPVNRKNNDLRAIKTTIQLIKDGNCVGIFPQGTRCPGINPRTSVIKGGAGMCAYHAKCDVLPVAVVNKKWRMSFMARTYIVIGKPIAYRELELTDGDKSQFERASHIIFDRICDLCDAYYDQL